MILTEFGPVSTPPRKTFLLTPHQRMLLMPIGDIHYGSAHWPERRFKDHIAWGADHGAYFLLMGEALDFTSTSQRAVLKNLRDSQANAIDEMVGQQIERLAELMKPAVGVTIGSLEGDHYHQYQDGTTTDQHLCRLLKAPFLGTSALLVIRLARPGRENTPNGCDVVIYAHHGLGGGRLAGSGLNMVEKLLPMVEADIYLMGHNHSKVNAVLDRLYRSPKGHLYHRRKIMARTGGFLVGYAGQAPQPPHIRAELSRGTYVEKRALVPTALGGLVISIGYKRHQHRATGEDICVPDLHVSV